SWRDPVAFVVHFQPERTVGGGAVPGRLWLAIGDVKHDRRGCWPRRGGRRGWCTGRSPSGGHRRCVRRAATRAGAGGGLGSWWNALDDGQFGGDGPEEGFGVGLAGRSLGKEEHGAVQRLRRSEERPLQSRRAIGGDDQAEVAGAQTDGEWCET